MKPETLFEPSSLEPPVCTTCGATDPGVCLFDQEAREGLIEPFRRRYTGCLVSAQLRPDQPLPF